MPKASRETALLVYEAILGSPGNLGISIAEISSAVGKSRGVVSAVLADLRRAGCVVGTQGERRLIRYSVVALFPLSDAEKLAKIKAIVDAADRDEDCCLIDLRVEIKEALK